MAFTNTEVELSSNNSLASSGSGIHAAFIRITTWNILNPVIDASHMFPGVKASILKQENRRRRIQLHLRNLDSDIVLLQEVKPKELQALLDSGDFPLGQAYEHHLVLEKREPSNFGLPVNAVDTPQDDIPAGSSSLSLHTARTISVPRALGSVISLTRSLVAQEEDTSFYTADSGLDESRGVAIMWRRNSLENVEKLEEQGTTLSPAAFVRGYASQLGCEVLFASKHLDALGCPPSVSACQHELLQVADAAIDVVGEDDVAIVFGGDCNLSPGAPAFKKITTRHFNLASGCLKVPSCFSVICASRLDHVFVRGPLEVSDTDVCECPLFHCCANFPFFYTVQVLTEATTRSLKCHCRPSCWCILGYLLIVPFLLLACLVFLLPFPLSLRRCRWALDHFGSDHLPVTVTLSPCHM